MSTTRTDIAHKHPRFTRKASSYLEDKQHRRHHGVDIPQAQYIGLTTAQGFERDVEAWHWAHRRSRRLKPGRPALTITLWPIVRQPHRTQLTPKRWAQLNATLRMVLGPGVLAKLVPHIPTREKKPGQGIPGPEQNVLVSAYRKVGPFLLPIRNSTRSLARELVRAMDQLAREWNREPGAAKVPEMPEVRRQQAKAAHKRQLSELLADLEEWRWTADHPQPRNPTIFRRPALKVLLNETTAQAALRTRGFEIEVVRDPLVEEASPLPPRRRKKKGKIPRAKIGFWRVRNPAWEASREIELEKAGKELDPGARRSECLVDGVRILCEGRTRFRQRLQELELAWTQQQRQDRLEREKHQAAAKQAAAARAARVSAVQLPPLIPHPLIRVAEKRGRSPLRDAPEASRFLACLEYPVCARQPEAEWLELGAGTRHLRLPRVETLLALQLAQLRGLLLDHPRAAQARFYFTRSQPADFCAPRGEGEALDPFDPCWQEAQAALQDEARQDDWFDALSVVEEEVRQGLDSRPIVKAACFYAYLHTRVRMRSQLAFLLTCIHFRSSAEPFSRFIASLQQEIQRLGLPRAAQPAAAKQQDPKLLLAPLPAYPPLPKEPVPAPDFSNPSPGKATGLVRPGINTKAELSRKVPRERNRTGENPKAQAPTQSQEAFRVTKAKPAAPRQAVASHPPGVGQPPAPAQPRHFVPADVFLPWLLSEISGREGLPASIQAIENLVTHARASVHRWISRGEQLVLQRDPNFETVVDYSALRLAFSLAMLNARLPADGRLAAPKSIRTDARNVVAPSKETCEHLQQLVEERWLEIIDALDQDTLKEAWRSALASSQGQPDWVERAGLMFGHLLEAGIDTDLAKLLVLSQLGGRFSHLDALLERMELSLKARTALKPAKAGSTAPRKSPLTRLLAQVIPADALSETDEDLRKLGRRAWVTVTAGPGGDDAEEVLLGFNRDQLKINRSELQLYVGLAALNARLARSSSRPGGSALELASGEEVPAEDRGFVSRRWLARLRDGQENLRRALSRRDVSQAWRRALESTQSLEAAPRSLEVYNQMLKQELSANEVLLLLASQAGPRLDTIQSLIARLASKEPD